MERRYREVTLKRKQRSLQVLSGSLLLVILLKLLSGTPGDFWQDIVGWGVSYMRPAVFRFQENYYKTKPTFLDLLMPRIFAYTRQSEPDFVVENITVEVLTTKESASDDDTEQVSGNVVDTVSAGTDSAGTGQADYQTEKVCLSVSGDIELALLQENIYEENKQASAQVVTPSELIASINSTVDSENLESVQNYDLAQYSDMAELIREFYIVDASTSPDASLLNIDELTSFDCTIDKNAEEPQILIYHSHSQEAFADSVPGEKRDTIVGAGKRLAQLLEEEYGYDVLHHEGVYDVPTRDNAYSNALPDIEQVLGDNPTVQVVIDLHRDAVAEGTKLVTTIDGKDYARFMFFNGICRSTNGPITYLNNPYLQENLAFSFQAQVAAESYFPGITRKIYLKAWRYNMHFMPRNMLIELGAQTNTVEEIMNTTEILAFVIDKVLSGQ